MRNRRLLVRFRGAYTRIDIYYIHNWWCILFSVFHCVILACHNKQIHRMRKECVWTAMLNANMNLICFPFFFWVVSFCAKNETCELFAEKRIESDPFLFRLSYLAGCRSASYLFVRRFCFSRFVFRLACNSCLVAKTCFRKMSFKY